MTTTAILREGVGNYKSVKVTRKTRASVRDHEDFDLKWGDNRIYFLGEKEIFYTHTSTNYEHYFSGPSVVHLDTSHGNWYVSERHVNDPRTLVWIARSIKEGYLSAETIETNFASESEVEVVAGK